MWVEQLRDDGLWPHPEIHPNGRERSRTQGDFHVQTSIRGAVRNRKPCRLDRLGGEHRKGLGGGLNSMCGRHRAPGLKGGTFLLKTGKFTKGV